MIQKRKNPVKRAFSGLIRPLESDVAPIAGERPKIPRVIGHPVEEVYCLKHSRRQPCSTCRLTGWLDTETAKHQEDLRKFAADLRKEIAESSGIQPGQKCVHGVYLFEHYCGFCAWEVIDLSYNPDVYRVEINKGLIHARFALYGLEGKKDFEDLTQIVDIEIWRATRRYGAEMNAKLAYTVAYNQGQKYLADRIEEQTVIVIGPGGKPILDEYGYSVRQPRFVSMDEKPKDNNGEEMEESPVEIEIHQQEVAQGSDGLQSFINNGGSESLKALAASWHGDKRSVAEAMLKPGFTVRDVPGVSKSQVSRVRQAVLKDFRALITRGL